MNRTLHPFRHHREQKPRGTAYKSRVATRRAEKGKGNIKDAKGKKGSHSGTTAVSRPTLNEELKTFKATVRHITKYETEPKTAKWFTADSRPSLRRLANLGINGHQLAIDAYCKMTRDEKEQVMLVSHVRLCVLTVLIWSVMVFLVSCRN